MKAIAVLIGLALLGASRVAAQDCSVPPDPRCPSAIHGINWTCGATAGSGNFAATTTAGSEAAFTFAADGRATGRFDEKNYDCLCGEGLRFSCKSSGGGQVRLVGDETVSGEFSCDLSRITASSSGGFQLGGLPSQFACEAQSSTN